MTAFLATGGERVLLESSLSWVTELIVEGAGGELRPPEAHDVSVRVHVEADRRPLETRGWELVTRGTWRRGGEVVMENACTAGFDLHFRHGPDHAEFTYRWRPPARERAAARLLRSRFHLLARAVLMQYPVLWWAGTKGRVPLHASACLSGLSTPLLTAPSGVGRSTLLLQELDNGGRSTGDNLAVGDGTTVWGLVEPLRVKGGSGRRMPHGRHELEMRGRAASLVPDSVVVLERGFADEPSLVACSPEAAARSLITSTYMAGELRRYWAFAATLAAGTAVGPAEPGVGQVASAFATSLPCFVLALGKRRGATLSEMLHATVAESWV
jgi:hypothetical protein